MRSQSRYAACLIPLLGSLLGGTHSVGAQLPDSVVARSQAALAEYARVCASRDAQLWRASLCGAIVLVDPESRRAVTNVRPPSGSFHRADKVFVGALPAEIDIANTAFGWSAQRYSMVMLPLSDESFDRIRLLAHESFHRIQGELGVPSSNVVIGQLEERDARYWLRLELRALSAVQHDSGLTQSREALGDALLFRARRYAAYPGLDSLEAAQELSEGLAEYSGVVVAASLSGRTSFEVAEWARRHLESRPTYARSYAYGAGPALGLALDRFSRNWRAHVGSLRSLSQELSAAIQWTPPPSLSDRANERALRYDGPAIAVAEDARAKVRDELLAEYRRRLIDGPVVILRQRGLGGAFNPNTIVPLAGVGLIYPSRTVVADWGELIVRAGGLLVASDRGSAWVTAQGIHVDSSSRVAVGDGWELRLAKGWTLQRGARDGDFQLVEVGFARPPAPMHSHIRRNRQQL